LDGLPKETMETENPYQSPAVGSQPVCHDADPSAQSGFRVCVVRGMTIGLLIGCGIYGIRCVVEGFFLFDLIRDTLVGTGVGVIVGLFWGTYRHLRLRLIPARESERTADSQHERSR
jgi:hypothetical protein